MRVIVSGGINKPILLNTTEASAILIETDDGQPTVIYKMLEDGNGWLRLVKGEDKNFNEVAKQLDLLKG